MTLDDLLETELRFVRQMRDMLSWDKTLFEQLPIYWTTALTDGLRDGTGHVFDLSDTGNGAERQVLFEEREEYVAKAIELRLFVHAS